MQRSSRKRLQIDKIRTDDKVDKVVRKTDSQGREADEKLSTERQTSTKEKQETRSGRQTAAEEKH
jgi:hypothetical protein